jgi:two-component system, NarL family, response regulator LiaR
VTERTTVLMIDDHRMFADALEMAGEEEIDVVGIAGTAEEAFDLCERHCPAVILMDVDLPGMDGIEATRRIMAMCPEARVVIVTTFLQGRGRRDALSHPGPGGRRPEAG